jgi:ankyrin repeat protein
MKDYIDSIQDDVLCPLDREKIHSLINVRYYEIIALNIINFSNNYYELLDKYSQNNVMCVSIIDHINLNYKDVNGKTLLYCACQRGNLRLVRQLVKIGGNATIADDNGFTPLMAAVNHNYFKIVKYLSTLPEVIKEINYTDVRGKTAVEYAFEKGHLHCLKDLLTVDGLDSGILQKILNKYQSIKKVDPLYNPMILEIKELIRKYLKLVPAQKIKIPITLVRSNYPIPLHKRHINNSVYFDPDVENNPDVLDLIYQPMSPNDNIQVPETSDSEINDLLSFNKRQDDLIYQPM